MSLSRKRRKELKRLQSSAEDLWGNQQIVLEHANAVAREASRQLGHLTREEVVPRVRSGYDSYVRPNVARVGQAAKVAGDGVEQGLGNVLGSILSIGDIANDARVRRAVERVSPRAVAVVEQKKGRGVGTYLAIGAGIVAAAGVAYAVWQTFRADDELWVADDEPNGTTGV
ncbi:DNA helicase [Agromyces sp. NPDC058136]|uniref:DNA helicase n=1 Tax=Agromyces sp. NPDC058136 TaxID=3346354 RepID=UPI0036D8CAF3